MNTKRVVEPRTDLLLTIRDVAEILSVSPRTISRWCEQGIIPKPITLGRSLRWCASEIQNHIDAKKAACPTPPI